MVSAQQYLPLLDYWFGAEPDQPGDATMERWRAIGALHIPEWRPDSNADANLKSRFGGILDAMASGLLEHWLDQPLGRLAYVLAADSLPRAAYRQTRRAYDSDNRAVAAVMSGIEDGVESQLKLIERGFFYMPLTHAEKPDFQECSLRYYRALSLEATKLRLDSRLLPVFDMFIHSAERHAGIIGRFGRFPHRNAVLQRPSTAEERKYLDDPWNYNLGSG